MKPITDPSTKNTLSVESNLLAGIALTIRGARGSLLATVRPRKEELCELAASIILQYGTETFKEQFARVLITRARQGITRTDLPAELSYHHERDEVQKRKNGIR